MTIGVAYQEYGRRGGIERASAEIADRVASSGVEVHFHAIAWEPSAHIHFHHVRVPRWPGSLQVAAFAWRAGAQVRNRYDVTHSYGSVIGCDVVTAQSCHRAGLDALAGMNDLSGERPNFGIADRIRLSIERANFAGRKYRKVIAVSDGVRDELIRLYGIPSSDVIVIPNGVDLAIFSAERLAPQRSVLRNEFGIEAETPALLFVGNEFRRKNLAAVIQALSRHGMERAMLLVAGKDHSGPYRALAARLGVADRVRFLGPGADMPQVYAATDIFVLPSAYEALSLAMVEAAASGLPVLMTRVHGATEFIRPGENGDFVEPNGDAIAASVARLLAEPERRRVLGAGARESARSYSWDGIARRVVEVYAHVADLRATPGRL
jgi:UDP-glucose:(heptosyl)LPS alpha-1,3-glucosyltransferase